ncbi:MAG: hypothetical protein HY076_08935, partial [Candidatus Eisenbacteria bacterium]|nr:hypothetical protein [Candidatus Eisenbacteria bacterium]
MSSFLRTAVHVALGAGLLAVAGLGGLWLRDRGARWERPRWPDDSFVPLRAAPVAATPAPCSVVAVNPRCPHCLAGLTRLASDW